jgi:hypothetical protein
MAAAATILLIALTLGAGVTPQASDRDEALFAAARAGDVEGVRKALDDGVSVNARARYDVTALIFAAGRGHVPVVRLLLERGADVNVADTFYKARAIDMALGEAHLEVARLLLERGSLGATDALRKGIERGDAALVKAALGGSDLDARTLARASKLAAEKGNADIAAMVKAAADANPAAATPTVTVDPAVLARYAGNYRSDAVGTVSVTLNGGQLQIQASGQPALALRPTASDTFNVDDVPNMRVSFSGRAGTVERLVITQPTGTYALERVTAAESAPASPTTQRAAAPEPAAPRQAPRDWPGFRGPNAAGTADGQGAVAEWDTAAGKNVKWKTPIPGIAVSSPVVAAGRVFVTTAVPKSGDRTFRTGLYGDVKPVEDLSEHTWKTYALDQKTGKILWEQAVYTGTPKTKRHTKSSQANSTPATDGKRVVSVFGSIGLIVCHDVNGKELWRKDLGALDSGWFFDPTFQWGHSSSPLVYRDRVIVQADQQKHSYLAAFDLVTGKELWRTARPDEISTWGTPTIVTDAGREVLVTNGTKVRGYDPATGTLLWTLGPNSEITVATPVAGDRLVYVTGGYPPVRPVYAIKAGASGDLTLPKGTTTSEAIAWSNDREGTYIPTPILYRDILYTLNNNGILTAYDAKTGERVYRSRVGGGGSFSASPIAADGRLYLSNEDGDVFVVKAGREYVELAKNKVGEVIMATPAISDGLVIVRTLQHVYAFGT